MSFKSNIPDIGEEWDTYWQKTSLPQELELVETDGLRPLFARFLPKEGKILEAGCGMGKWVVTLAKNGYDIEGVDANEYALKKLKTFFPEAKVKKADVRTLPYPDGSFAACLSLGVVEHFEEGPNQALLEAHRVLKKDGIVFIEVPFDSPLRQLTRIVSTLSATIKTPPRILLETLSLREKRASFKTRFYEYRYTKAELEAFLKKAGFAVINIFPKDDLSEKKSIALWLDYPFLQKKGGKIFELTTTGKILKRLLQRISPFTYCALIVALGRKL